MCCRGVKPDLGALGRFLGSEELWGDGLLDELGQSPEVLQALALGSSL